MSSSGARATRSRYSSPAHQSITVAPGTADAASSPMGGSAGAGNDASRSFMQRWLEPSVQAKPSFEEAGLVRFGVLEGMAPLGALPKPKKMEAVNGSGSGAASGGASNGGVRKITLKVSNAAAREAKEAREAREAKEANGTDGHSSSSSSRDGSSTPVPSANAVAGRKRPASPGTTRPAPPSARAKAGGKKNSDDEEYNPKSSSRKKPARKSVGAASKSREAGDADEGQGQGAPATQSKRSELSPGLQHYPTAWALRTLYDEKSEDPGFDSMVTDVLQQTADDDTLDGLSKHLGDKKRDGKEGEDDSYFFAAPPSTAAKGRFTPNKGKPAADVDLVKDSEDEEEIEEPEELPAEDMVVVAGDEAQEGERRAAKKAKTSHAISPRLDHQSEMEGQGPQGAASTPSRKRQRRDSASSDSSLSSAMTLPSPEVRNKVGAAAGAAAAAAAGLFGGPGGGEGAGTSSATSRGPAAAASAGTATGTATGPQKLNSHKQPKKPRSQTKSRAKIIAQEAKGSRRDSSLSRSASVAAAHSITASYQQPRSPPASPSRSPSPSERIHNSSRAHQASMPGRLAASATDLSSRPPKGKASRVTAGASLLDADAPMQQDGDSVPPFARDELDATWSRRRDAQSITNNYTAAESSVRSGRQQRASTPVAKRKSRRSAANAPPTTRTTRSATKRPNDRADGTLSPVPFNLPGDDASTVGSRSRAATPTGRPAKRPKGLRVKSSPVKKSGGPAGGLPRLAESQSSFRAGTPKDPSTDNDEFCSACGNAGDVLCCDGCPRSFHFECVNLSQEEDLPDDWFCSECIVRRFPSRVPIHKGAFAGVLNNLEKSIPRAFSLPKRIQNRFEGVKAGPDGDYDEVAIKPIKKRTGYDELPDLLKQRDENQPVLCHLCQKPSDDTRAIIPCSQCPFYWHLDCLDPPMAVPPLLKTWRCPIHVDDVLSEAPRLAPAHKFRKVKNTQPITPMFTRGNKNNGHIEIDWSDEPEPLKDAGWPDPLSFGRTYKVSANGVILDFIEQLRKQGAGYGARQDEQKWVPYPSPAPQQMETPGPLLGSTLGRQVDEMQASLNLIGLKQKPSDGIDQLTSALLSNADESVLSLMARGNADNFALGQLTDNDRLSLRAMLAQMDAMSSRIRQVLGDTKHVSSMPTPDPTAATPPPSLPLVDTRPSKCAADTGVMSSSPIAPKKEEDAVSTMATLPEPTPPLTIENGEGSMDLD